ncbi:dihydropteroate synthase [Neorickettsia sp. 179522]|nr:dihydropteroate synthase [Neorickettsia sp. 179522]
MRSKIVGTLNITPDSFFDGGKFFEKDNAIRHALHMIRNGADIIEMGAESTRPDAEPISQREEINRLDGILQEVVALCKKHGTVAAIDSYNPETVEFAVENGVTFVNSQKNVEEVAKLLVKKDKVDFPLVLAHALTIPVKRDLNLPDNVDVIETLKIWFEEKLALLESIGIPRKSILLDPGLGFGKTNQQCYTIVKNIESLRCFVLPIFVGHSNKRLVKYLNDQCPGVNFTLPISAILFAKQVEYIRVHLVKEHHVLRSHFF